MNAIAYVYMADKKGILKRFFIFLFFTTLIMASSVVTSLFGPPQTKYTDDSFDWSYKPVGESTGGGYNVLVDTHSHTLYSDGILTVEQNIKWHIANGFNVSVITDHDTWAHIPEVREMQEKYKDDIILFAGSEWTTNVIHMNIILPLNAEGYEDLVPPSNNPTYEQIQQAINDAHDLGGLVTINHFNWSLPRMPDHPTRQQVYEWGADYIEVVNQHTWDQATYDFTGANEMGVVAATDMHSPEPVKGWTTLQVDEFTRENIWAELVARNTSVIYQEDGSPNNAEPEMNPKYRPIQPLSMFGDMLVKLVPNGVNPDWTAILVMLGYFIGGFAIAEIYREYRNKNKEENLSETEA